uniref:Capsid protein n=1 Tax=Ficedula parva Genomoviridae sp. TaxID=2814952 RepID=A0A8A4XDD9_9VIRU|nr:MAG: capsid protein [Gemycircularvirus]
MAYRRYVAKRRSTSRRTYRKKRAAPTRRKRTYRKKTSRRSLLNVTSRKKRNGMNPWTNQQGDPKTVGVGALVIPGTTSTTPGVSGIAGYVIFRPTAMDLDATGTPNTIANAAQRTSSTCYMKGFAENIRIETNTGNPWFHRRICFTSKDPAFYTRNPSDTSGTDNNIIAQAAVETTQGWQRLTANMNVSGLTQTGLIQRGIIFKGAEGVDWDDAIVAPLDTTRIGVKFDKTWVYKSGNERGILREHKLYHPMNHNIVYDDDETGSTMAQATHSVIDNRGMGNYLVLDIFSQGSSGSSADRLMMRCNSTLYWHEK